MTEIATNQHITHIGQVIPPEDAQTLGDAVLTIHSLYLASVESLADRFQSYSASAISPTKLALQAEHGLFDSEPNAGIIDTVESHFSEIAGFSLVDYRVLYDIAVGTPGLRTAGRGDWHIDDDRGFRLLVNLSRSSMKLLVGEGWDRTRVDINRYLGPAPMSFTPMTYGPGEGVLVDNNHLPTRRTLHAGVPSNNKVFMRLNNEVL